MQIPSDILQAYMLISNKAKAHFMLASNSFTTVFPTCLYCALSRAVLSHANVKLVSKHYDNFFV